MEKFIRIAIPTNDGINVFSKMLGMAKEMYIYEINDKGFRFIEKRSNPHESSIQHLKTLDVYELISDCNVIISNVIGKKGAGRFEKRGMKLFFRKGKIKKALEDFIEEENYR